jgi:hypothetical protein
MSVYATMQRHGVSPDAKFFGALVGVAGTAGNLSQAFNILADMSAEGIRPMSAMCTGLIHACICGAHYSLAQRVYDLCAAQVRWLTC